MMSCDGNVERFDAQRDAVKRLDGPEDQAQSGGFGVRHHASEAQDHAALPFLDDVERIPEPDQKDDDGDQRAGEAEVSIIDLLLRAGTTAASDCSVRDSLSGHKFSLRCSTLAMPAASLAGATCTVRPGDPHHTDGAPAGIGCRGYGAPELAMHAHHALK